MSANNEAETQFPVSLSSFNIRSDHVSFCRNDRNSKKGGWKNGSDKSVCVFSPLAFPRIPNGINQSQQIPILAERQNRWKRQRIKRFKFQLVESTDSGTPRSTSVTSPATTETGLQPLGVRMLTQSSADGPASRERVLTRMTSSDSLAGDEFSNDDELTHEQAEIRWIIAVILRYLGAGLVVWLGIRGIMKA